MGLARYRSHFTSCLRLSTHYRSSNITPSPRNHCRYARTGSNLRAAYTHVPSPVTRGVSAVSFTIPSLEREQMVQMVVLDLAFRLGWACILLSVRGVKSTDRLRRMIVVSHSSTLSVLENLQQQWASSLRRDWTQSPRSVRASSRSWRSRSCERVQQQQLLICQSRKYNVNPQSLLPSSS